MAGKHDEITISDHLLSHGVPNPTRFKFFVPEILPSPTPFFDFSSLMLSRVSSRVHEKMRKFMSSLHIRMSGILRWYHAENSFCLSSGLQLFSDHSMTSTFRLLTDSSIRLILRAQTCSYGIEDTEVWFHILPRSHPRSVSHGKCIWAHSFSVYASS